MNQSEQILLAAIQGALFGIEAHYPEDADWDAVVKAAREQAVFGLVANALPAEVQRKWEMLLYQSAIKNTQNTYAQTTLWQLLKAHQIPMVVLKGTAASVYYPDPSLKALGDIDFYVAPDQLERAKEVLAAQGFEAVGAGDSRHFPYKKDGISYELHHRFSYDDLDIEDYIAEGVRCAQIAEVDQQPFPMLPPLANGLVLLAHMRYHLKSGLGLRQIIDWMMYCHQVLSDRFWASEFLPACKAVGMDTLAITVTRMCQLYMGLGQEITWCQNADVYTCEMLLENLFASGNFGAKNAAGVRFETVSTYFKSEGFFRYLQRSGEITWEAYHKHPGLKPFCWFYQLCRYTRMTLKSKRGTKLLSDFSRSEERAELLKRLGI